MLRKATTPTPQTSTQTATIDEEDRMKVAVRHQTLALDLVEAERRRP